MDRGLWYRTGGRDHGHPQEKEMQKKKKIYYKLLQIYLIENKGFYLWPLKCIKFQLISLGWLLSYRRGRKIILKSSNIKYLIICLVWWVFCFCFFNLASLKVTRMWGRRIVMLLNTGPAAHAPKLERKVCFILDIKYLILYLIFWILNILDIKYLPGN